MFSKYYPMKKTFFWIGILFFIAGCGNSGTEVYSESKTFPGNTWQRFSKLNFRVPIEKPNQAYNFFFTLEYDSAFAYDYLPVHGILNTPSGEERIFTFDIQVRDSLGVEKGTWLSDSECYQVRSRLWQGVHISEKGHAQLSIEQLIPKLTTQGIHSAGVEVTSVKN